MVAHERADRLEGGLRGRRLRRLLGRDRRSRCARQTLLPRDQQLPRAAAAHGRTRHHHGRGRREREDASGAAGDGGKFRIAMRLLHAGFHHVALRGLLPQGSENGRAARRTTLREFVPLHRLPADSRRGGRRPRAADRFRRFRDPSEKSEAQTESRPLRQRRGEFSPAGLAPEIVRSDGAIPGGAPDRRRDRTGSRNHEEVSQIFHAHFR